MLIRQIEIQENIDISLLFGSFDENMKLLEKSLNVTVAPRDNTLQIKGEEENGGMQK